MKLEKIYCLMALVVLTTIAVHGAAPVDDEFSLPDAPRSEAQSYYDQVPIGKRDVFIRYFLGEGLKKQGYAVTAPRYVSVDLKEYGEPPQNFDADLLSWTKSSFGLEDAHVQTLVENAYVCIPSKGCYDPNDIGGHCCPL